VSQRVALIDLETLAARVGDHVGVGIDAFCLDALFPQEPEELAAAAADVEHGRGVAEVVHVDALAIAHVRRRAAHLRLEREVVRDRRRRRLRGNRRRRGAAIAPLGAGQPLLQLRERAGGRFTRRLGAVELLEHPVHQLQHGVVEDALLSGERLDVPAHQGAQQALDRRGREPAQSGSPVERPLGGHRPDALGPMACRKQPPATSLATVRTAGELLAKTVDERGHVNLAAGGNRCSGRGFRLGPGHLPILSRGHYGSVSSFRRRARHARARDKTILGETAMRAKRAGEEGVHGGT